MKMPEKIDPQELERRIREVGEKTRPFVNPIYKSKKNLAYLVGCSLFSFIIGMFGTCAIKSKDSTSIEQPEQVVQTVSREEYDSLQKRLEAQNEDSRKKYEQSQNRIREISEDLSAQKTELKRLGLIEQQAKEHKERADQLKIKLENSFVEAERLKEQNAEFEKENKAMKDINNEFKNKNKKYLHPALSAFAKGEWDTAIDNFQSLIMLEPREPSLHYFIAQCYEKKGFINEAQREYKNALTLNRYFSPARTALEDIQKKLAAERERNSLEGRIKSLEKQIQQNPEQELLYLELGKNYVKKGDKTSALVTLEKGIQKKPVESKPLQTFYVETISTFEELNKGIELFESLRTNNAFLELEPAISELYVRLGKKNIESDNLDDAVKAFEKGMEINPKWAVPYCELGEVLMKIDYSGNFKRIANLFQTAIKFDKKWSRPFMSLARLHKSDKDFKRAIYCYRDAIRLGPSTKASLEYVQYILEGDPKYEDVNRREQTAIKQLNRARKFFRTMIQRHPKERNLQLSLAEVYMGLKEWDNAVILLERDRKLHGANEKTLVNLGRCYKERNLIDFAKLNFETASKLNFESEAKQELENIAQQELALKLWLQLDPEKKKEQEHLDYNRAIELFEDKEFNSALWLLDRYTNSGSSSVHLLKGQAYMAVGRFSEAKKAFKKAESLEENKAKRFLYSFEQNVLRYFIQREKDVYAITNKDNRESMEFNQILFELWMEAHKIIPENQKIKYRKSELARKLGKDHEHSKDWNKSIAFYEQDEHNCESLYRTGKLKEEKIRDLEGAIKSYRKYLRIYSGGTTKYTSTKISLASALTTLGNKKIDQGKAEEAIIHLSEALIISPDLYGRYRLAIAYKEAGELASAERHFREVTGSWSMFLSDYDRKIKGKSLFELGLIYKNKNIKRARDYFKDATKCNSNHTWAYLQFGELSLQLNDQKRAKWAYEKAAELGSTEAKTALQRLDSK